MNKYWQAGYFSQSYWYDKYWFIKDIVVITRRIIKEFNVYITKEIGFDVHKQSY